MKRLAIRKNNERQGKRQLGLGIAQSDLDADAIVALFASAAQCAVYALDTVAKVQWQFGGPISHAAVNKTLGAKIDILGSGANPDGVDDVYSTQGLINGEFQTYVLACAIGVHLEVGPTMFSARGNAFTRPTAPTTQPFSPGEWTVRDQAAAWAGSTAPSAYAYLAYNLPAAEGFWAMVRAYNLRWSYGSLINILDEQLRETAYMPPNAQEGSASSSQIAILRAVREVNDRYNTPELGCPFDFLPVDTLRVGSVTAGGTGVFLGNRDLEFEGVTYGGSDLRSKIGIGQNSEFRSLENPMLLKAGVPIGMSFQEQNEDLGDYMRAQFDATQGFGGTSATYTPAADFVAGPTSAYTERTIDGLEVTQQQLAQRIGFKGFQALMSNEIKGWEMTETLGDMVKSQPNLAARICSDCGCQVGWA
jgi:hypothetical protein